MFETDDSGRFSSPLPLFAAIAILGLLLPTASFPAAHGQIERYELGKRLQRFERAWQNATIEARRKSTPAMQAAVSRFFSLDLNGAAASLDSAWMQVDEAAIDETLLGAVPYRIEFPLRLLDTTSLDLPVSLTRLYSSLVVPPNDAEVQWDIVGRQNRKLFSTHTTWEESEKGIRLPTAQLPDGDFWLNVTVVSRHATFSFPRVGFSRVKDLNARLDRLDSTSRNRTRSIDDSLRATLREHGRLFRSLAVGDPAETDYPVSQMLELDELWTANPSGFFESVRDAGTKQDLWISLAKGRARVPVRLRFPPLPEVTAPATPDRSGMGVLFLFHGAGGSENMFFETYGAGGAVQKGLDRNLLVIAPRQGLMGMSLSCSEMLDIASSFHEIDRNRVFAIGHSMGAAQAIKQAQATPNLFRGVAIIGGGRPMREAEAVKDIGWYVAAGELDFGRSGATAFFESLQQASPPNAKFDVVPDVEHMVIVQAALKSTFEFFDSIDVPAER